jgi:hypothetical protein
LSAKFSADEHLQACARRTGGNPPVRLSITHKSEPFEGQRQRRNVESEESLVIHC